MKHILFLFLLTFSSFFLCAQSPLELNYNMFRNGDKLIKQQVEYKSPGESGKDVLWDYSRQKLIDDAYELEYLSWDNDSTIIGREHRTLYKYRINGDSLFCIGYENATMKLDYLKPELILTFPFRYQDRVHDYFYGKGEYSRQLDLTIQGDTYVNADAYGTMILPEGDTLTNIIRIHTVKRMVEENRPLLHRAAFHDSLFAISPDSIMFHLNTDSILYQQEIYRWYAVGYRYPVFETVQTTVFTNKEPVSISNTAFYYTPEEQYYGLKDDKDNTVKRELMAYEKEKREKEKQNRKNNKSKKRIDSNISEKINYSIHIDSDGGGIVLEYQLLDDYEISMSLYDVQGRLLEEVPRSVQSGGFYKYSFSSDNNYISGTYLLKMMIDKGIITEKVVCE